ncbi:MAG TPA: hypothetical protein VHZ28_07320 [Terracidiphilus sp.]|jgi:hypothetical protein|nr:hypothetical protein [Terracidiphilus sp.]
MKNFARITFFVLAVASSNIAVAQPAAGPVPPVPPAVAAAKTVFISNGGADSGLFPQPFSGDPNRAYAEFYSGLQSSGAFQLVNDPSEADLVLELQLIAPSGPTNANKQNGAADPRPMFRLTVYDRKSHYTLWTVTQSIALAMLQKTHDRNFDDAIAAVLDQLLAVANKHPLPSH